MPDATARPSARPGNDRERLVANTSTAYLWVKLDRMEMKRC